MSVRRPLIVSVGLSCAIWLFACESIPKRARFEGPMPDSLPVGWEAAYELAANDLLDYTEDLACFEQTFQEVDKIRRIRFLSPWSDESDFEGAGDCGPAVVYEFDSANRLIERVWQR